MGTRSFVGVMKGEVCRTIYVHWDGYLKGVGSDLQEYATQAAVEAMIEHGDRSSLTEGYYKDRGEDNVAPQNFEDFVEFYDAADQCGAEWYYIFKDGTWYCGNTYVGSPLCKKLIPYKNAVEFWAIESAQLD